MGALLKAFSVVVILPVFFLIGYSEEDMTKDHEEAVNLVYNATRFILEYGEDSAISVLNNPDGAFVENSFYVFGYDTNGYVIAHPMNQKLIGKNLLDVPDVDGKYFRRDIINLARTKVCGWIEYKYKSPEDGIVSDKMTYFYRIRNMILCCCVYK